MPSRAASTILSLRGNPCGVERSLRAELGSCGKPVRNGRLATPDFASESASTDVLDDGADVGGRVDMGGRAGAGGEEEGTLAWERTSKSKRV